MGNFFIRRPIVAMVISIVTVIVGLVSLSRLPIAQYPEITPPLIQVTTTYIGASALDVEQSVATPIEQQVNGVERSIYLKSTNANDGTLKLEVSFEVGSDLDISNVLTQNRVSQATPSLPTDVKNYGVSVKKSLSFPLMLVTLTSPSGTYDSNFLSNYALININDQLARISGVGQVTLFGGSDYAMRIWVRPDRLQRLGLTVIDLVNAVKSQNLLQPSGQIGGPPAPKGTEFTYQVKTQGRLLTPEEFAHIIVRANPDGSVVRLGDVARLDLGSVLYNAVGRLNGKSAAVIAIYQIPGSNALEVQKAVRKTMAEVQGRFPAGIEQKVTLDTTAAITAGIDEIITTLFEAVVLVIIVVFIFLQNWRATLIPLLTVPVSLLGTFMVFPLLGFSVNTLSLLGLVLAIGIVVDDAIVVVEAVMHHIEQGKSPKEATAEAMRQVSGPVIAIALVLTAVFVPVAFISGISGRLYQQFAITIAISVIFSAINALTLSPALSSLILKPKSGKRSLLQPFYGWFNRMFGRFTDGYLSLTGILVRKAFRSALLVAVVTVLAVVVARRIPGGFVPDEDNGYFFANIQLPDAASLERTDAVSKKVEALIGKAPGVEYVTTISGYSLVSGAYASNTAFLFVSLKPWEERKAKEEHAFALMAALNRELAAKVPEAIAVTFGPPPIIGLGSGSGFTIMLQDRSGGSPEFLADNVEKFLAAARKRPEIGSARTTFRAAVPQIFADIDRDKVTKLGVPVTDVNSTLGALLGGTYVNDFNRFGRTYKVYLQAEPEYRGDVKGLGLFSVRTASGGTVPLDTLLATRSAAGPEFTNRFNLYRAAEVTGQPAEGFSSSQALAALEETAKQVLPPEMGYQWSNVSYQEKQAEGTAGLVFVFAIVLVFLVLAAQYESWSLPLSVLLGTPFAAFGAFLGLYLARLTSPAYVTNVFAQIGLVMLVGLAAKNAILIVEFAKEAREKEGLGYIEAAMEAAKLRLRPILMTAFAFILGVVPLVRAAGAGAEGRKVMGMAVFAGMLIATILGVVLVPVLFVVVERLFGKKGKGGAPAEAAAPEPRKAAGGNP
ncbi:efflux RND transporter permease subunit [Anaeromyxobacter oryzae]|uniref:Multidrug efflux RND transporter permease subunit n=1 Tax=Anaeromyxobacter oryzae TaxID=2918170 RepID=A0ABM7WR42_9BACT|nr:multidrug efflux RND transporter permease subunit [Anaeromyxobacter oryzae]BDG01936.1 multidrug efflux RND transporter permease subunit [Anaeromyxobacter oryzae]